MRSSRFALSFAGSVLKRSHKLVPISTHEQLDAGIAVVAEIFTTQEALTVIKGISFADHVKFLNGLHKSLDESEARGVRLSTLAVDEEGRIGAAFLVFPTTMKYVDETVDTCAPIGVMLDELHALALPNIANTDHNTTVWFGFAAVKESARGQGLQKHAKRLVVENSRMHGFKSMITECTSTASAKSMLTDSGLGTKAYIRASLPYETYNNGEFAQCVAKWGCDAAVLVEEML